MTCLYMAMLRPPPLLPEHVARSKAGWVEGDECKPVNAYGRSKLEAEEAIEVSLACGPAAVSTEACSGSGCVAVQKGGEREGGTRLPSSSAHDGALATNACFPHI